MLPALCAKRETIHCPDNESLNTHRHEPAPRCAKCSLLRAKRPAVALRAAAGLSSAAEAGRQQSRRTSGALDCFVAERPSADPLAPRDDEFRKVRSNRILLRVALVHRTMVMMTSSPDWQDPRATNRKLRGLVLFGEPRLVTWRDLRGRWRGACGPRCCQTWDGRENGRCHREQHLPECSIHCAPCFRASLKHERNCRSI